MVPGLSILNIDDYVNQVIPNLKVVIKIQLKEIHSTKLP